MRLRSAVRLGYILKRKLLDPVKPIIGVRGARDKLQIADHFTEAYPSLMGEYQACESATGALPIFSQGTKSNILSNHDTPHRSRNVQQLLVRFLMVAQLGRSGNINIAQSQLHKDGPRHMHVGKAALP
jgi:hypothetical protein